MEGYEKGNWRYDYSRAVLLVTDLRDCVLNIMYEYHVRHVLL